MGNLVAARIDNCPPHAPSFLLEADVFTVEQPQLLWLYTSFLVGGNMEDTVKQPVGSAKQLPVLKNHLYHMLVTVLTRGFIWILVKNKDVHFSFKQRRLKRSARY